MAHTGVSSVPLKPNQYEISQDGQVWQCTLVIPAPKKLKQDNCYKFKARLSYMERLCLKTSLREKKMKEEKQDKWC